MLSILQIIVLGLVQGAAELLPVSSSAHVIVAEKLMRVNPSGPQAMFVLAMLHTGTMFAVLVYFWRSWVAHYFSSKPRCWMVAKQVIAATVISGVIGEGIIKAIEKGFLKNTATGDIEELSNNLLLIGAALAVAGIWIVVAGIRRASPAARSSSADDTRAPGRDVSMPTACKMGFAQALALPFRGLSRSGVTISTGILAGAGRRPAEEFSFLMVIVLTPAVIGREFLRLHKAFPTAPMAHLIAPGLVGLVASFIAGLAALVFLSRCLEAGRWRYFGYYCLAAAVACAVLAAAGY